ncbi:hypothetical protein OIU77_007726 [Salix suchowensis]|uniref:Uncharacterized protein n=1 Tax=Salix suchowensis TaxID=1278906 RepID=A0ABQ9AH46_9ROSI|nr:hypothetical protein OIU77_007726 [Salix suchowensis]
MVSRSCISLLDLASGNMMNFSQSPRSLPKIKTFPGIISDVDGDGTNDGNSDSPSTGNCAKMIIVSNFLPLNAKKDLNSGKWSFSFDEDSLLLQMKDGFSANPEVVYVGSLRVEVDSSEQEEVSQKLLEEFNCVPTFIPPDIYKKFYHGFCKHHLWPLFHYMLPLCPDHGNRFDRLLWQAYVSTNKIFADKVMEVYNPEDYVWVHDYHLMVLPTFLRKRFNRIKLGFFLHSPFPSSEIYRTLLVRDEILKALLNADLIGFHTFDYARHFLTCCSRMLGLNYESKRGHICLEYFGRTVYIKILPVGIHMGRVESALNHPSSSIKVKEIQEQFKGKRLVIGVDDMDMFKGISLKLLAVEHLLLQNSELCGKLVLVQIVNPARSSGKDVQEAKMETYSITKRINDTFGFPGYEPVVLIDRHVPFCEKTAYYALAECCIVNPVRDGMNLIPIQVHCCSPSLSGAIRVNPWDIEAVANAVIAAIDMPDLEKQLRHEKHYCYVSSHDVAYWARSFMQDLKRACKDHYSKRCWDIGFGLNFRILSLSPSFRKLSNDHIISAYKRTSKRAIFLDYDGTMVPHTSIAKNPTPEVISVLNNLCADPMNNVFIVSGRGKESLSDWFVQCENLGIAAEHGYFLRWSGMSDWETSSLAVDFDWKNIAEPCHEIAKELLDHLENVLANDPVAVKRGQNIVEVKPQGVTKGLVTEKVLSKMIASGKPPGFVLCIGDDRSDEDMFESISNTPYSPSLPSAPAIFACTVGQKPSKARYYLDDTVDVLALLQCLADASSSNSSSTETQVSFDNDVRKEL